MSTRSVSFHFATTFFGFAATPNVTAALVTPRAANSQDDQNNLAWLGGQLTGK